MKKMSVFEKYCLQHNVSVAQSIGDRDYPMTHSECWEAFIEIEGRNPTPDETKTMRPDSEEALARYIDDCRE